MFFEITPLFALFVFLRASTAIANLVEVNCADVVDLRRLFARVYRLVGQHEFVAAMVFARVMAEKLDESHFAS